VKPWAVMSLPLPEKIRVFELQANFALAAVPGLE
jgi:hypothetical protein